MNQPKPILNFFQQTVRSNITDDMIPLEKYEARFSKV
jgi:hypothetical protein